MRKKNKEITNFDEIEGILQDCNVCHLGMCINNEPYVVPINYGYEDKKIYVHCAKEGKKIDILKQNPKVWVNINNKVEIIQRELACKFTTHFESVMALGIAHFISDKHEMKKGLDIIMKHISGKENWKYKENMIDLIEIIEISLENISGKRSL